MRLVDSHCHLDAPEFDLDRDAVIARARAAGVEVQIVPAVMAGGWEKLRKICEGSAGLHPAYGLHPMYLDRHSPGDLDALEMWLKRERPCALGECGLDFHVEGLEPERQRFYFEGQLELAREFNLPVILHARRAVDAVIHALRRVGGLRGVVHSWSGSDEQARQLGGMGFLLGIGGPVTFERARRLRRQVAELPLEWLLLETDAPDQPPSSARGMRNEPERLEEVLVAVAALREVAPADIAAATAANACRLFGLAAVA